MRGNLKAAIRELKKMDEHSTVDEIIECLIDTVKAYRTPEDETPKYKFRENQWVYWSTLSILIKVLDPYDPYTEQCTLRVKGARVSDPEEVSWVPPESCRVATLAEIFRGGAQVRYKKTTSEGSTRVTGDIIQVFLDAETPSLDLAVPAHTGECIIHAAIHDCELIKPAPQEEEEK